VVLHPLWEEDRRRFFIRFAHRLYQIRGTLPGIVIALRIFLDETVDDSLFDPECLLRSNIRIVEHFLTREVAGSVFGDPTGDAPTAAAVAAAAHRFTVLLPHRLQTNASTVDNAVTGEALRMAERIIELEKPAHTWFEIKEYWNMFRVGEARLGLDTLLHLGLARQPALASLGRRPILGRAELGQTRLEAARPLPPADRIGLDRGAHNPIA